MKIKFFFLGLLICLSSVALGQKQITKEGTISIFSQTPLFTISGTNHKVASILNTSTGDIVVSTLVRSFKFKEALVEEHFNEDYMQSDKYPKATFVGKITNINTVKFDKDGTYPITIKGKLTIHGTTNEINEPGTIVIKNGKISAKSDFSVSIKAYKIRIEKAKKEAIKDDIRLQINFNFKPYNK